MNCMPTLMLKMKQSVQLFLKMHYHQVKRLTRRPSGRSSCSQLCGHVNSETNSSASVNGVGLFFSLWINKTKPPCLLPMFLGDDFMRVKLTTVTNNVYLTWPKKSCEISQISVQRLALQGLQSLYTVTLSLQLITMKHIQDGCGPGNVFPRSECLQEESRLVQLLTSWSFSLSLYASLCFSLLTHTHLRCAKFLLHTPGQPPAFTVFPGVEIRTRRGGGGRAGRGWRRGQAVCWGFRGGRVLLHAAPLAFLHQPLVFEAPPAALPVQSWVPHPSAAVGVVGGRGEVWGWRMAQRGVCPSVGPDCLGGWRVGLRGGGLRAGFAARGKRAVGLSVWERRGDGGFRRGGRWGGGGGCGGRAAPVLEDDAVPVGARVLPFLRWGFAFAEGSGGSSLLAQLQHLLAGTAHWVLGPAGTHLTHGHWFTWRHQVTPTDAAAAAAPGVLRLYGCRGSAWTAAGGGGGAGGCSFEGGADMTSCAHLRM